ncbi:winged helix-turn-helix domain-containing protein [Leucobacter soli]|uniref:Restriction system protein Mrr-like N-terminal domain-containing protein n=1 Tax=Leucobacter soli TaxID=2812850 RepID=A0A916NNT2_9MICO|nr:winged helix-turn-helix domain-containing protein [Leucobacter soli]CAG7614861.1 hypothetical protein LEUCIP111803_01825 [Leucobacter soli]
MVGKEVLKQWLVEALSELGGSAHHVRIAERIWAVHEGELRAAGDLFYTWQYDLRWAAQLLRNEGYLQKIDGRSKGIWNLTEAGRMSSSVSATEAIHIEGHVE